MNTPRFVAWTHGREFQATRAELDGLPLIFEGDRMNVWGSEHFISIKDQGCLVGHLFTRSLPSRRITSFSKAEADRIIASKGASLIREYWGGYAAFLQTRLGVTRIVRDPSGTLPVYWRRVADEVVLAAELGRMPFRREDGLRVDSDALATFLWSPQFAGRQTCIAGVSELLPGFAIDFVAKQAIEKCLWSPWDYVGTCHRSAVDNAEMLRSIVLDTIRGWSSCFESILLGMSGGLDSTIVAAALANAGAITHGLTMFGPDHNGDERSYATIAADAFGISLRAEAYSDWPARLDTPVVSDSPRPFLAHFVQPIAHVRDQIFREKSLDAFFSGNGGDNVFCSLNSVTPIVDRILARNRPGAIIETFGDVARLTNADMFTIGRFVLARFAKRRRELTNGDASFLDPDRLARAAAHMSPHPWLEAKPGTLPGANVHIRKLRHALGNDGFHSRATHPPSIAPLLAQPIVELCLTIPSWQWVGGGVDRSVAHKAFSGLIPKALLERKSGGGPSGFVHQLYHQNEAVVLRRLQSGFLQEHGILSASGDALRSHVRAGYHSLNAQRLLALLAADTWANHWERG